MALVTALYDARGAQRDHVVGTKVLKGTLVDGTDLHSQLRRGLHHGVGPEQLLLVVFLKVSGAERHLTLQAGLHGGRLLIYALIAENLHFGIHAVCLHVQQQQHVGLVVLNDAAKFEIYLQVIRARILLTTFWAARQDFASLIRAVNSLADTGQTVVVPTGESHRIRVELEADGTAQLVG